MVAGKRIVRQAGLFFLFYIPLLIVYHATIYDLPRSDHVLVINILNNIEWGREGLMKIFSVAFFGHRRFQPRPLLLHYLETKVFWDRFYLYHLLNLAFHAASGVILFNILVRAWKKTFLALIGSLLFLFAYTHSDILSWPFHFYVILQMTLVLGAVLALIRGGRTSIYIAYGLVFIQLYLYEPGVVFPGLLFLLDVILAWKKEGFRKRFTRAAGLTALIYAVYLATIALFFAMSGPGGHPVPGSWGKLLSAGNIVRAMAGTLIVYFDTAFLHNILPFMAVRIDELVFFTPVRFGREVVENLGVLSAAAAVLFLFLLLLLAPALKAMGKRGGLTEGLLLLLLLAGGLLSTMIILLGRTISHAMSQSRYVYLPALVVTVLLLHLLTPYMKKKGAAPRVTAAVLLFLVAMNAYRAHSVSLSMMTTRARTNGIYYAAKKFIESPGHRDDRLFIAASTYPPDEHLAWGAGLIPKIFLFGKPGIAESLTEATHMLLGPSTIVPVKESLARKGPGQFSISFGLWIGRASRPVPLNIFGPPGRSTKKEWFVDVEFAKKGYVEYGSPFAIGRVVFGAREGGKKKKLYTTRPFLLRAEEMNLITIGRDRGVFFLIFNRRLIEKRPDRSGADYSDLEFTPGTIYLMESPEPIYIARTFIQKGYVPWPVADSPLLTVFSEIPYRKKAFRKYSSTLWY